MPTQIYDLTQAPVNLVGATDTNGDPLDLEEGSVYSARYVALGPQAQMKFLAVAAGTMVLGDDMALPILNREDIILKPKAGEDLICWSEDEGVLVINPTE